MRIGVTGHQDIPPQALQYVARETNAFLDHVADNFIGISSLAAGADQLFASLVLERGGRLEVVLPCRAYETSFLRQENLKNFHALLARAATVETLSFDEPSEDAYLAAGHRVVDLSQVLLAVWDGQPARGKGGTADIVKYAKHQGTQLEVIWPKGMKRG